MTEGTQGWESEEVFHEGDTYFSRLKEAIAQARHTIDLESYIFGNDEIGKEITLALNEAARRGVLVRLMVDGVGSVGYDPRLFLEELNPFFQARVFRPVLLRFLQWRRPKHSVIQMVFEFLRTINSRNHRKTCIIDAKTAFAGSLNITSSHSRRFRGEEAWRDTSTRVDGPEVAFLTEGFERSWRQSTPFGSRRKWIRTGLFRKLTQPSGEPHLVRLNHPLSKRSHHYRDFLQRISSAQKRVWLTNAYFAPHLSLIHSLKCAAKAGADVRILLPRKTDVWIFRWVTPVFYYVLVRAGVRIYEYLPSILHAKSGLIDDWGLIGSSNLNYRSLIHDLEVDLVVSKPASIQALEAQFLKDIENSSEIDKAALHGRSLIARVWAKLGLLIRRWI